VALSRSLSRLDILPALHTVTTQKGENIMRHALIIAGGAGTRLWPMSRRELPKQLIPFIDGRSLLQLAFDRLKGLVPAERIYVCAAEAHREMILSRVEGLAPERFIGEPVGRDTLNAVGLGTGVIARDDPEATVAVFTADHLIEPMSRFQAVVEEGYGLAEASPNRLMTFGIRPTYPATGYGYLQLGESIAGSDNARRVARFKEKPDADTAQQYYEAGPDQYLWNSGMFVWQSEALMAAMARFAPQNKQALDEAVAAWGRNDWQQKLAEIYPALRKVSVDHAVMEPASQDEQTEVAALPMPVQWLDVGSWPALAETRPGDDQGNVVSGAQHVPLDTTNSVIASSDPDHLIATIGCEEMIVVHTRQATLVCPKDQAQRIKDLHKEVEARFGDRYT